ncbi:phosphoribosyltransferase family protein [Candidatus Chlorohelix sp.]|uniref:phosphoribosyltransferase n=1 Tax=Candidatus Chlorohelix sp. TaxID=3139201 RepID=UPI003145013F
MQRMVNQILRELPNDYDNILVITRGGMVPACLISEKTNIRNILVAAVMFYEGQKRRDEPIFLQFPEDSQVYGHKVLVVDDVWDTGQTVMVVRERLLRAGAKVDVAVLHFKPSNSQFPPTEKPDFYAEETDAWIVYPWDPER